MDYPNTSTEWAQRVSEGLVSGYSFIQKFGENPDIDTGSTPEDIWDAGGLYTFSTSADIEEIASSDAGDTMDIEVQGLDADWKLITQTVTLTGQTVAPLATPLIRVFRMKNMGSTDIAGIITLGISGMTWVAGVPSNASEIRAQINNGNNQTLMCIYTIPAGKTGYFYGGSVSYSKSSSTGASITLKMREFGGVFQVKNKGTILGSGTSIWSSKYSFPLSIAEKTDVLIRAEAVETNNTGIGGGFTILLKDN